MVRPHGLWGGLRLGSRAFSPYGLWAFLWISCVAVCIGLSSAPVLAEDRGSIRGVEVKHPPVQAERTTPQFLYIANHMKVVVYRGDHLEIREVVRLLNPGSESSSGSPTTSEAEGFTLHLPLPRGYTKLKDLQGLTPEHVHLLASGLYYTAPLAPGEHRVVYTYALPFRHAVTTILAERTLPTAVLDVLVEDKRLVASSDLQFRGRVSLEPHTFFHFRGTDLQAHTRSWLKLTRQTEATSLFRVVTYGTIIGIVLLGVGLPLWRPWRHRAQQKDIELPGREQAQELNATRLRLLQAIARLDAQHEKGELAVEEEYQQQRQIYKTQLLGLFEQLQEARQDKDSSIEDV